MRSKLVLTMGGVLATLLLCQGALFADAELGPWTCDEKAEEIVYIGPANACYQLKATCKGDAAGSDIYIEIEAGEELEVVADGDPGCAVEASDEDSLGLLGSLKGECKNDRGNTKLELKRTDLCTPCCLEPDDVTGCVGVCL